MRVIKTSNSTYEIDGLRIRRIRDDASEAHPTVLGNNEWHEMEFYRVSGSQTLLIYLKNGYSIATTPIISDSAVIE